MLAGCFLALALLPASSLCDLMQVLPASISPSLFFTFPSLYSLSLSSFVFLCTSFSNHFLLFFESPSIYTYITLNISLSYIFLTCLFSLSHFPFCSSLSHCRVRSGNSICHVLSKNTFFLSLKSNSFFFSFCPRTIVSSC